MKRANQITGFGDHDDHQPVDMSYHTKIAEYS